MSARERTPASRRRVAVMAGLAGLVGLLVVVSAIVLPLFATSTSGFFSRYHLLNRRYVNLEDSAHEGVGCRTCHETNAVQNGVALVGDFYRSLVTSEPLPAYFAFAPPKPEACLKCHESDWAYSAAQTKRIPHPAHTRVAAETRDCAGCHKWTAHFEGYIDQHEEMPFSGLCASYECHVGTKQLDQCLNCHHVLGSTAKEWDVKHAKVAEETGESACLESCHEISDCQTCHATGQKPEVKGPPIQISSSVEELHAKPEWTKKYHGAEALKNRDECLLCHESQGQCQECHRNRPAFHGRPLTWIGQHSKATKDVADPRCIECHEKAYCEECHDQFKEME